MFLVMGQLRLYFDPTGFAAARIEVRALRVVMIPALAMETVCCSLIESLELVGLHKMCEEGEQTHHHFVEDTSGGVRHLVKLVDATHSSVREYEGTARVKKEKE